MIYWLNTLEVTPGKMAQYEQLVTKQLLPFYSRVGIKLIGSWRSMTGNPNEIYALFAYDDLAAFQRIQQTARQDKEYVSASVTMNSLLVGMKRQFIEPNTWSPMK